ncbi:YfiR family protein [Sphaerotilus sp.]|uniref:YfiR family protein n=1 Tax=Sphaerotilus sp. TaxID=2093942 RepID=UPI002ACE2A28|nr:YfiR family protein [Sphaerotilus sp.]MDZ7854829.1 YfiR family protein [Sphaerotilus sp.]
MLLRWRTRIGHGVGLGCLTLSTAVWSAPWGQDPPTSGVSVSVSAASSHADHRTGSTALRLTVVDAVLGILAHTRWPQHRPHSQLQSQSQPLQLCVNERSSSVLELRTLHERVASGRLAPVRLVDLADALPLDCDAVYLGAGPAAAEPLAQLTGRPVLTMGEGAEFCSSGGLFCLVPRPGGNGLRVEVNLDAVARSGLHVHPQVLKIGLPRTGVAP